MSVDVASSHLVTEVAVCPDSVAVPDRVECVCKLLSWVAVVEGMLSLSGVHDEETEYLVEELTTELLELARPSYIPNAAYYAAQKAWGLGRLALYMGDEWLSELLRSIVEGRKGCEQYHELYRAALLLALDVLEASSSTRRFMGSIAFRGSCEELRSALVLLLTVKPASNISEAV